MLNSNLAFKMVRGRVVQQFPWDERKDLRTREPFAQLWAASVKLNDLVPSGLTKLETIDASPDFTPTGRTAQKLDWVRNNLVPELKAAMATLQLARQRIDAIKAEMTGPVYDRSDIAGAMQRQEIRSWLRNLPPSERQALFNLPDELDPAIAAAVFEMPAALSGLPDDLHANLRDRAVAARHPDKSMEIDLISAAAAALDDQVRMAHEVLRDEAGLHGIEEMTGMSQPFSEALAEKLAALPAN